jgi:hypothetical protein
MINKMTGDNEVIFKTNKKSHRKQVKKKGTRYPIE